MTKLEDCLGRIYQPLQGCATCIKDDANIRCPCYQPHHPIELIDVGDVDSPLHHTLDEYGECGNVVVERNMTCKPFRFASR